MSYDLASWKDYGNDANNLIVEIKIREVNGTPIDHFISHSNSQFQGILKTMKDKYGIASRQESQKQIPITMIATTIMVKAGIPLDIIDKVKENLEIKGIK